MKTKKVLAIILFFIVTMYSNVALSEKKQDITKPITVIEKYTYEASEVDSKVSSRANAMNELKRLMLEKVGTFVISVTEVNDFKVERDKIEAWTAGIIKLEILQEDWNGKVYFIQAKVVLNPEEIQNALKAVSRDVQLAKDLEKTQRLAEEARDENRKLKAELEKAKSNAALSKEMEAKMAKLEEGKKYLAMAMEAAKYPNKDREADLYENKAIAILGQAYVRSIWPKEIFFGPSDEIVRFPKLAKGTQMINWIRVAKGSSEIIVYSEDGIEFLVVYGDGVIERSKIPRNFSSDTSKMKFRAYDDQEVETAIKINRRN